MIQWQMQRTEQIRNMLSSLMSSTLCTVQQAAEPATIKAMLHARLPP
jgi:outer membrane biogenesis lipoprotein LolB